MTVRLPPALEVDAHKGDAGRLLIVAGSSAMPGAAILACRAAQRGGAGLVALVGHDDELARCVAPSSPETVHLPLAGRSFDDVLGQHPDSPVTGLWRAIVAGPGLGASAATRAIVDALIDRWDGPLGLDADALNVLAGEPWRLAGRSAPTVVTPHPGEATRLLGRPVPTDDDGRAAFARELAQVSESIVGLKGHHTVVADGERVEINETGNPGMATAGSGDVLLGLLGAYLLSVGPAFGAFDAALAAVHVHGLAGDLAAADLGQRSVVASDLIDFLPAAQRLVETGDDSAGEPA